MNTNIINLLRNSLRNIRPLDDPIEPLIKIDESLTPNMRALRLVMSLAEQLLSMGVAASDVVHMSLGITNAYCKRRVQIDITYTQINISQDRGVDREPLTLIRSIVPDDANYQQIQALQSLALKIRDERIHLGEAERELDDILSRPRELPRWLIYSAGGAVGAGVVLLYGGSPIMIATTFMLGFFVTWLLRWMGRMGVATFYSQIIASLCIILATIGAVQLDDLFALSINPTLMAIGGIVLLVAGMMIVGAFQDAIDEFYVTANARLLKVAMATAGVAIGVLIGLFIANRLGISFPATPDRLTLASSQVQYIGALVIAASFATRNHARLGGTIVAGGVGMFGWWVSRLALSWGFGAVIATGIAATIVGLVATLVSRFWKIPSLAIIAAGIVPLVPGLSLYNGLMGIIDHPPSDPYFMTSLSVLSKAVMIGLAVAAGATLGNMLARPLRRRVIKLYNRLPNRRLSRN